MPRRRGKDSNVHKQDGGTRPAPSEMQRRKRERDPRSKEAQARVRDPDAVERDDLDSRS